MQNIKPVQKCAKYEMRPVQYAQVSYFVHFSRLFFCNFEINGYFHFFYFFGGWGGGGWGGSCIVAVEVILEGFISGIESPHIIYFYFHLSITQKLNLSQ